MKHPALLPSTPATAIRQAIALACISFALVGCGGGGGSSASPETASSPENSGDIIPALVSIDSSDQTAEVEINTGTYPADTSAGRLAPSVAALQPDPGVLLLLVPDTQSTADPRVMSWVDAASELGVRLQPVTDTQFLQMGATANGFAGLILPDSLHTVASDTIIAAIDTYTRNGGNTFLTYDFGALTLQNGVPVYPIPKSRLSGLAGVDYVLYDELRDRTTGLGPVTATRSTLRALLVPPGKSKLFTGLTTNTLTTAEAPAVSTSLVGAAGISQNSALYLPVSTNDPGGVKGYDPQQYSQMRYHGSETTSDTATKQREVSVKLSRAKMGETLTNTSRPIAESSRVSEKAVLTTDPVEAYSGYLLGNLIYPTFVTQGTFGSVSGQQTLATSPQFGLVAGLNSVGAGKVMFVNLPLTYLKGRTDALMMHGFLNYFTRNVLNMAHLSPMPNGVAGMTFDWHLDSKEAQAPTQNLMRLNVFNDPQALFSIEMTSGPDTIVAGDKLGWNLANNATAKQILKTFQTAGHSVGAHGGWIHDFYGGNATETNQLTSTGGACLNKDNATDNFLQCLIMNRRDVDAATGFSSRNYSAPEGNNPPWAMTWLENQGVVSAYFAGHTGLGATRQYRDGNLANPNIWVFPVTPQGTYATFEEWQDFRVPKTEVLNWYKDLIDFNINLNTSRMVYAHPPGANRWSTVLKDMLTYAKSKSPQFAWYTSNRLADFMSTRLLVNWNQTVDSAGVTQFTVTHPTNLNEMVWRLPKSKYTKAPVIVSGNGSVITTDSGHWLVKAGTGTQLVFKS